MSPAGRTEHLQYTGRFLAYKAIRRVIRCPYYRVIDLLHSTVASRIIGIDVSLETSGNRICRRLARLNELISHIIRIFPYHGMIVSLLTPRDYISPFIIGIVKP